MNALTIATMSGVIGGVVFGLILRQCKENWHEREVMYVSYIGEIFLRMLKALILPLIVPSLITAVGSLGEKKNDSNCDYLHHSVFVPDMSLSGKVGLRAVAYYFTTTIIAVILGIFLVVSIHPGVSGQDKVSCHAATWCLLMDCLFVAVTLTLGVRPTSVNKHYSLKAVLV